MRIRRLSAFPWSIVFLSTVSVGAISRAGASPAFTVSATDVSMSVNGGAYSQIKLSSVDGYSGTTYVDCAYAGGPTDARLPVCSGYTMQNEFHLDAGQTITFNRAFYPYGSPLPMSLPLADPTEGAVSAGGAALAGVLLLVLGSRRRTWRGLVLMVLGAIPLVAICGCGGIRFFITTTPGTFRYNIIVVDINSSFKVETPITVVVH